YPYACLPAAPRSAARALTSASTRETNSTVSPRVASAAATASPTCPLLPTPVIKESTVTSPSDVRCTHESGMQPARSYSPMTRLKPLAVTISIILVSLLALIGLLSITRGTPLRSVVYRSRAKPPVVSDSSFRDLMALFIGVQLEPGNRVEQLLDGDGTYPRLWADRRT